MPDAPGPQAGSQPTETVADRLERARRRTFVGRTSELALFRAAVGAAEPPFAALFVHGPGGVGKTALLHQFAACAEEAGVSHTLIDLRAIEPSPPSFEAALTASLGVDGAGPAVDALTAARRHVLLLDTFDAAGPLCQELRARPNK